MRDGEEAGSSSEISGTAPSRGARFRGVVSEAAAFAILKPPRSEILGIYTQVPTTTVVPILAFLHQENP